MPKPFDNKVVAITGSGKGLGLAYAHYFATLGAKVVVNNRRHDGEAGDLQRIVWLRKL